MFNFFRRPEPEPQELSYIVMRLTNDPGIVDCYRRAGADFRARGYDVNVSTPTMTAEDAARFRYGIEVEIREEQPIAGKLMRDLDELGHVTFFYDWEQYDPLDVVDDHFHGGFGEYDPVEAAWARYEAFEKALDFQWKATDYQLYPTTALRNELLELARSVHPYPLDPYHPVYWS